MTPEVLRRELERAEEAQAESDEQLRALVAFVDRAQEPKSGVSASDCAKVVRAALDLNQQLRTRMVEIRSAMNSADLRERMDKEDAKRG